MEFKFIATIVGIGLVLVYAFGSGIWVSSSPGWYSSLNRPPWQPPSFVFGIIWPYNFTMLGIAAYNVAQSLTKAQTITWLLFFGASVASALVWAYQFYVPHNLVIATIALGLAALLTLPVTPPVINSLHRRALQLIQLPLMQQVLQVQQIPRRHQMELLALQRRVELKIVLNDFQRVV
jgi:translocator protein